MSFWHTSLVASRISLAIFWRALSAWFRLALALANWSSREESVADSAPLLVCLAGFSWEIFKEEDISSAVRCSRLRFMSANILPPSASHSLIQAHIQAARITD
jgi:hypothetical protein